MDEPGSAKAAVAAPTKRRLIKLSLRGVTKAKVANVVLLLLAATIFSTAILDEISGSEVAERVFEILAFTLILLSGLKWRRGALAVQLPSRRNISRNRSQTKSHSREGSSTDKTGIPPARRAAEQWRNKVLATMVGEPRRRRFFWEQGP